MRGAAQILYGDILYYNDFFNGCFRYQNIHNIQPEGLRLVGDSLEYGEDDPLKTSSLCQLVIGEYETEKNGGYPVLYLCVNTNNERNETRLVSFNTKTKAVKDLHIGNSPIGTLYSYGEYILYDTYDGDKGYNIHIIKCDGSGHKMLDNPESKAYRSWGCKDEYVYFYTGASLYRATLELENPEFLFDDFIIPLYFYGDRMYYQEYSTRKLVSRPFSDLSVKDTVIDEKVTRINGNKNKLVFSKANDVSNGINYKYYMIDLDTNEIEDLISIDDEYRPVWSTYALTDKYLLLAAKNGDGVDEYCVIDLKTKEKIFMKSGYNYK